MRPSLLHQLGERRLSRRRPPSRRARAVEPPSWRCDPAVQRVREAGGPVDRASYTCVCGYLFRASVSTTVTCPHCGTDQAW